MREAAINWQLTEAEGREGQRERERERERALQTRIRFSDHELITGPAHFHTSTVTRDEFMLILKSCHGVWIPWSCTTSVLYFYVYLCCLVVPHDAVDYTDKSTYSYIKIEYGWVHPIFTWKFFFFPCEPGFVTIWGGGLLSKALILAEKIFFNSINMKQRF